MSIIPFDFYTISSVGRGRFLGGYFVHNSCQSMCYDARNKKYIVGFAMPGNVSALVKMKDLSFAEDAVEMVATELPLDHCNDMVYDPDEHKIYVVGGNWWVAVVDPDTLRVERKIPVDMVAWSLARYQNGDWFVHEVDRGARYNHDFSISRTVSINDVHAILDALGVPDDTPEDVGCWQGAIVLDGVPYMIYNEYRSNKPTSFVLFSCEMDKERIVYRAETGHEIESADYVDGKMMLAYNEPYRYGGCEWEMSEILMKTVYTETEKISIPAGKSVSVNLSKVVPSGYQLAFVNVNIVMPDGTVRTLPHMNTNGTCLLRVMKVNKYKFYLKSTKDDFTDISLQVTCFCRKK